MGGEVIRRAIVEGNVAFLVYGEGVLGVERELKREIE
jgi:hypothetical protein